jgi:hypothetical protein
VGQRHSGRARADGDFYCEPAWCVEALFQHLILRDGVHDPCCGLGTIVDVAAGLGMGATGADIVDRAGGRFPVQDFLSDETVYENIVINPPYRPAEAIIRHALAHVEPGGRVAVLVPIGFLASQRRYPLFARPDSELLVVLSRRPSLPPGELLLERGESVRRSGSTDYAWMAWRRGRKAGSARIRWAPPKHAS